MKMRNSLLTASIAAGALAMGTTFYAPAASAATIAGPLTDFTGDTAGGKMTFTDAGPGTVNLFAEITAPTIGGDIRGLFFNVLGGTDGLNVTGTDVTSFAFNTCNLGGGNNLEGGGPSAPCAGSNVFDVGISIGQPGAADGTITSTQLTITRAGLTASSFLDQTIGMRLQSTGADGKGSSKLSGTAVPTPALLPGLIGMGAAALRKRKGEGDESAEA